MKIFETKGQLSNELKPFYKNKVSIGFVPTMGALHQGHLSLVKKAVDENAVVVVSIFVNPTQFDNPDDLAKYPSTLTTDVALLSKISEQILIFAPNAEHFYDGEVLAKTFDFGGLENVMEGAFRGNHFNGVGTVVDLLLQAVKPTKAYFGEKDFQQLQIIKESSKTEELSY